MGQLNPTQQALTIFIMPTKVPMKTQFQNCELWCSVYKSKSPFSELVTVINWFNLFSTLAQENEAARWRSGQRGGKSFFFRWAVPSFEFSYYCQKPIYRSQIFLLFKCEMQAKSIRTISQGSAQTNTLPVSFRVPSIGTVSRLTTSYIRRGLLTTKTQVNAFCWLGTYCGRIESTFKQQVQTYIIQLCCC